jgi:F-box/leucine-rich repeat protein 2/20
LNFDYKYETRDENSDDHLLDVAVSPQLESLCLTNNINLTDECIKIFVSLFPNLQLLNLCNCYQISEQVICHVLERCCKIRHLDLGGCSELKLLWLNFEVPNLEVLNLAKTKVDDETLYVISKSCRGLLQLSLQHCSGVTEKGVKHVVENCTQLREINLRGCRYVDANFVASMVLSRPLLRKITTSGCPLPSCRKLHI